jgi:hypothetical protein
LNQYLKFKEEITMAITNSFRNAVSKGDIRGIRIMMKDSMLVDPTFAEFNEMSRLARGVRGLYDSHDGRALKSDKSAWNDDYMDKLMVQVVGNFSHERLAHLKNVVKYLRPVAAGTKAPNSSGTSRRGYQSPNIKKIGGGAVVGAIIGGLIGAVINGAAGGAIVGAAGAIVGVAIATNKEH